MSVKLGCHASLAASFNLKSPSCWQESMSQILDPLVTLDFGRWQHQRIVKSLLYQGDSKMAARYLSTVQPSLSTPEEVKLKLTVLLANG